MGLSPKPPERLRFFAKVSETCSHKIVIPKPATHTTPVFPFQHRSVALNNFIHTVCLSTNGNPTLTAGWRPARTLLHAAVEVRHRSDKHDDYLLLHVVSRMDWRVVTSWFAAWR